MVGISFVRSCWAESERLHRTSALELPQNEKALVARHLLRSQITETLRIHSNLRRFENSRMELLARIDLDVQALVEALWRLKQSSVGDQPYDIPHPVENRRTVSTGFEMRFHP